MADELAAADPGLRERLRVAPGVEIRSQPDAVAGRLALTSDWNLAGSVPGSDEGVRLTLRASGTLSVTHSLSDGFGSGSILPTDAASTLPAASFRLVGGADLAAADPLATRKAADNADVVIGRPASSASTAPPIVLLRTTRGSIDIAAGRDVRTTTAVERPSGLDQRGQTHIYTTGQPVPANSTPGFEDIAIRANDQFLRSGDPANPNVGPFFEDAGDIRIRAARDVLGSPAAVYNTNGTLRQLQYVTDWLYRQTQTAGSGTAVQPVPARGEGVAMWSRYDLFAQGVASFGGGSVEVRAGRDIRDLDASTPFSGYRISERLAGTEPGAAVLPAQSRWWGGGELDVRAGRDVVGGLFFGGGATASLVAEGDIGTGAAPTQPNAYAATQLFYGDTQLQVQANGALRTTVPTHPALIAGAIQGIERQPRTDVIAYLAPDAAATLLSTIGDVALDGARPLSTSGSAPGAAAVVVPDELTLAAPAGAVRAGTLAQLPVGRAVMQLLAEGAVEVSALRIAAAEAVASTPPQPRVQAEVTNLFNSATRQWSRARNPEPTQEGAAVPSLRAISRSNDVALAAVTSFIAGPVRLVAERDLVVGGSLLVQHAAATDGADTSALSLLQAGRDLRMGILASVRLSGPGELVALAGRDIDFGRGQGVITIGNQDNDLQLPKGGANVALMAGVGWSDYRQAVQRRFHLLGSGFRNHPAELLVQLESLRDGGRLLDAPEMLKRAAAFADLDAGAQRARVAALVGEATLQEGLDAAASADIERAESLSAAATDAVRSGRVSGSNRLGPTAPIPGGEFLPGENVFAAGASEAEREAAQASVRTRLYDALQSRALADVLAGRALALDAATHDALALAVSPYTTPMLDYVSRLSGTSVTDAADGLRRFEQLAPARQAVFVNRVLAAELNVAGNLTLSTFADAAPPAANGDAGATAAALARVSATAIETPGNRVNYLRGFDAMDALFPGARPVGQITLSNSQVKTAQGGDIRMLAPGGGVNVGDLASGGVVKSASDIGVVSVAGGSIDMAVAHSVEVNQSRIFTLQDGNLLLWAKLGNLDAGRGAKTVVGAPPPLFTINSQGQVVVDTSGSFSGSGIAVLDSSSIANLFAPLGEINAGDAGIAVAGQLNVGANTIANFDNVQAANPVPGQGESLPSTAGLAGLGLAATAAGNDNAQQREADEQERRKRRARRSLLLDFLGFSPGE